MTAQQKIEAENGEKVEAPTGLALLRAPFPDHAISKLPKPTKRQTDEVKADFKKGIRCKICGGWHHPQVVHLDYVGHAALTDRLLDCDPQWNWEPLAFTDHGTPALDENGGMWIKLTVCGVTRYGYGHPDGKRGGDAIKEVIGDALRNAAMRFGAALDLWHKGQLHPEVSEGEDETAVEKDPRPTPRQEADRLITQINKIKGNRDDLAALWERTKDFRASLPEPMRLEVKAAFEAAAPKAYKPAATYDDEIPYGG